MNDKGFGDYSDGFSPDDSDNLFSEKTLGCSVSDDITKELGDPEEALFAAAMYYRDNNSCPVTATAKTYNRTEKSNFSSVDNGFAVKAIGDPFETTADSYLDATLPTEAP